MIKWILSKWYKHSPDCMCGYRMKPTDKEKLNQKIVGYVYGKNVVGKCMKHLMGNHIG